MGNGDGRLSSAKSLCGFFAAAGLTAVLLAPVHVGAQRKSYDPREMAMLPSYCKYTQLIRQFVPGGNDRAELKRWTDLMGGMFMHMHHYCWGLMHTNKALFLAKNRKERMLHLNFSIREFDYVIRNAKPDFVLLPEILTKKGENLIRLGRAPQGIPELVHAIELKADYWPPYAVLSDYFKGTKDLAKAREWLEKGLSASPDAKALQQRLAELGGGKGQQSASPPQTKPQPPAESAVSAPPPQTENPEPPAER